MFVWQGKRRWGWWVVLISMAVIAAGCGAEEAPGTEETGVDSETEAAEPAAGGFDHITGIDAGAGIMQATEEAIEAYGLDIELVPSSSAAMTAALASAIENEEWIVVTGWTPHWKFAAYDLKYLDDPLGIYGEEESIHTLVRQGLEEDHPSAYQVLDNFYWTPDDMNQVMVDMAQHGLSETEAARQWIEANREVVDSWIEGVEPVDGDRIELVYVTWDSEIASNNVIALVLEEIGYEVELTPVEAGVMFAGVASGEADAMVAAWLPGTHAAYYEDFKDDLVDLGPNLDGAKIGLVVPTYVDIDSIEEIRPR
ncbi:glycine/betaine ABC transporter substrate-binding protein [Caldalkalibacillus thermarum]|uniref:glycine betaine ABC transporter substrate-binding protein n=1 Tax=Caldalkalibacillus thermarum TaxID=296745 RepID=UPI001667B478|nr:glycine betaine ABC transporter substrate-binding protein [Caldalkalibacillus thermarum]GGK11304.1 glycine/betaine ABC transporter substrate-binding protein [Caldalkalibacillus thermarum]